MNRSPYTFGTRTTQFSKDLIRFCKSVAITPVSKPLIDQVIRSGTSIGANYAEANNAASKTDFRNKIFIAKKEAAETEYWLTLLEDVLEEKTQCVVLLTECHYLLMTLQKIISTLRDGERKMNNARQTVKSKW
jgi:four helix bundle protein